MSLADKPGLSIGLRILSGVLPLIASFTALARLRVAEAILDELACLQYDMQSLKRINSLKE